MQLWHATIIGGTSGLLLGGVLEIAREMYSQYSMRRMILEFESQGMSPPLVIDLLRPHAIPVGTCVLFALLSALIYIAWSRRN